MAKQSNDVISFGFGLYRAEIVVKAGKAVVTYFYEGANRESSLLHFAVNEITQYNSVRLSFLREKTQKYAAQNSLKLVDSLFDPRS
ncbi:hypothetical protein [Dysgonomonas macrotermitis]|uniref:Uncharacterized protein n=1 Tax=Dysgonomonas macrotermitis TaxID=1346286 RepID=A0A1M4WWP9_9BACT|nr:hypothetical protein [Dysgonomonas macrotermitis]SHE85620.1 hypothetical protein SAMN05444362_102338 [Dysgonomonas macrotermitis]